MSRTRLKKLITEAEFPEIVSKVRLLTKHPVIEVMNDPMIFLIWSRFSREMRMPMGVFRDPDSQTVSSFEKWCNEYVD